MENHEIDLKLDQTTEHYKMSDLTENELQYARTFARSIDVTDKVMVLQYGTEAQRKVKRLSESAHLNIPENDLNEIEMLLKRIIRQLNEFEDEVKRTRNVTMPSDKALQQFRSQYDAFNSKLGECARRLEIRQNRTYGSDPEYRAYVKKTPIMIPLIPLYSVEKYKWLVA